MTIASFNKVEQTVYYGQEMPVLELDMNSGGEANRPLYKNDIVVTGSVFTNSAAKMDIEQSKLSGSFDWTYESMIDFAVQLT